MIYPPVFCTYRQRWALCVVVIGAALLSACATEHPDRFGAQPSAGWALSRRALSSTPPSNSTALSQQQEAWACIQALKLKAKTSKVMMGKPLSDADFLAYTTCRQQLKSANANLAGTSPAPQLIERALARADAHSLVTSQPSPETKKLSAGSKLMPALYAGAAVKKPSAQQRAGLRAWAVARGDRVSLVWSPTRAAPQSLHGSLSAAVDINQVPLAQAILQAATEVLARVEAQCPSPAGWTWKLASSAALHRPVHRQLVYERYAGTVRVVDNRLKLSVGPVQGAPELIRVFHVTVRCRGDLPAEVDVSPSTPEATALAIAVSETAAAVPGKGSVSSGAGQLEIVHVGGVPRPTWRFRLEKADTSRSVLVDAKGGAVLQANEADSHLSVKAQVRHPYGSGPVVGGLPNVHLYDGSPGWSPTTSTDGAGDYGLANYNANFPWWTPKLEGPYTKSEIDVELPDMLAVWGETYGQLCDNPSKCGPTSWNQRRLEAHYSAEYARMLMLAAWAGAPRYDPLQINLPSSGMPSGCGGDCCGNGEMNLDGWCAPGNEDMFRYVVAHEYGHTPRQKCGSQADMNASFMGFAWEEAEANFFSYVLTQFEVFQPTAGCGDLVWDSQASPPAYINVDLGGALFFPDDKLHADATCAVAGGVYDRGNPFIAIFLEVHLDLGWRDALYRVFEPTDNHNTNTGFGTTSSGNTFYAHMLDADAAAWARKAWQLGVTEAWSRHSSYIPADWDWPDQWPGAWNPAYLHGSLPAASSGFVNIHPAHSALPANALEHDDDHDYVWFFLRGGVTYSFRTSIPGGSGVDTVLELVRVVGGTEQVVGGNDDHGSAASGAATTCLSGEAGNGSLSSCFSFQPASSGYFGLRVRSFNFGSSGSYDLAYAAADDAGGGLLGAGSDVENMAGAYPLSLDPNAVYPMRWQSAGDDDWFRVQLADHVQAAGSTLHVEVCANSPGAGETDDADLWLFRRDTTGLTYLGYANDNSPAGCGGRGARIDFTVPAGSGAGTVEYYAWSYAHLHAAPGSYSVRAWVGGANYVPDLGGPNVDLMVVAPTNLSGAQQVGSTPETQTFAGRFQSTDDTDWYRLDLSADEHVSIHTLDVSGGADTVLELFADSSTIAAFDTIRTKTSPSQGNRSWMRMDDDGAPEPLASRLHFVPPRSGTYYLRVRHYQPAAATGTYTLYVQRMGNVAAAMPPRP